MYNIKTLVAAASVVPVVDAVTPTKKVVATAPTARGPVRAQAEPAHPLAPPRATLAPAR